MKKTEIHKIIAFSCEDRIGQLYAELKLLKLDDSIEGLQKKRDIKIKLALLSHIMEIP